MINECSTVGVVLSFYLLFIVFIVNFLPLFTSQKEPDKDFTAHLVHPLQSAQIALRIHGEYIECFFHLPGTNECQGSSIAEDDTGDLRVVRGLLSAHNGVQDLEECQ